MLHQAFVTQPASGVTYLDLFRQAFERAPIQRIDAAVAYATSGGVTELSSACREADETKWRLMKKRWLIGIDYCRTDPLAIRRLQELPNSKVRIHAGREVIKRMQCTPILPYHPKLYLMHGFSVVGAICGSGNLSTNGLTKGHEIGNLMLTKNPSSVAERQVEQACRHLARWYATNWNIASEVDEVFERYQKVYESIEHLRSPTPTDDDAGETDTLETSHHGSRGLGPVDLRRLRACRHLWIESGNLTKNRGPKRPGNQLMLTPMTRVYFGFPAHDLAPDTFVGMVAITYGTSTRRDCSLVFSNNSMDKLTLPVPDNGGPPTYDQKDLLFERLPDDRGFAVTVGTATQKKAWVRASQLIDANKRMTSGRRWGVF